MEQLAEHEGLSEVELNSVARMLAAARAVEISHSASLRSARYPSADRDRSVKSSAAEEQDEGLTDDHLLHSDGRC